jgi:alpha-beta hydrolase superfamily lysophospholipase
MVRTSLSRPATALMVMVACGLAAGCVRSTKRTEADVTAARVTQIGVNSFLWRASLDTLSFMPMLQVDSSGGVILTDWYINPRATSERMKLTVTILDQDLRADALRVAASRQVLRNNEWIDAPVEAATTQKLEDIILTHARDLRRRVVGG